MFSFEVAFQFLYLFFSSVFLSDCTKPGQPWPYPSHAPGMGSSPL